MTKQRSIGRMTRHLLVLGGAACAALTFTGSASARTITVGGNCSLPQAVTAVNTRQASGGCAAGNGGDIIVLPADSTTVVSSPLNITRSVTIQTSAQKRKAILVPSSPSLSAIFQVNPLLGTAASVTFTDLAFSAASGGASSAIVAFGRNSTDKVTVTRANLLSFFNSAIFTSEMSLTVSDSFFESNSAEQGGAIHMEGNGSNNVLNVSTSSFFFNSAASTGGAIFYSGPSHSTLANSTFSNNFADQGGAFAFQGSGILDIKGCTVANNEAALSGGGGVSTATVNFTGTLLAANFISPNPDTNSDWDASTPINSFKDGLIGHTASFDFTGGPPVGISFNSFTNNQFDVDTSFGRVVNNPGFTFDLGGDLLSSPPTISVNPPSEALDWLSAPPAGLTTDQRGFARGVDAPTVPGGNRFDVGAFEYDPNLQMESVFVANTSNGTLSGVNVTGFQPSSGAGVKFVPGASGASSVTFRLPIINVGGTSLVMHVQTCSGCGKYDISIGDLALAGTPFTKIATQNYASSTTKVVTMAPIPFADLGEDEVLEIKFTLVSKPAGGNGQLVLDFIKLQP